MRNYFQIISIFFAKHIGKNVSSDEQRIIDIQSLEYLRPMLTRYLPWTGSSIRPTALRVLLNEIILNKRRRIVECGGGVSTILLGKCIKDYCGGNGAVTTIEHDLYWSKVLRGMIEKEGLQDIVNVICAPLEVCDLSVNNNLWYSTEVIGNELDGGAIDLLLVDGPLANRSDIRLARYPAVPYFFNKLSDSCFIALDDVHRTGERQVIKKWSEELGLPVYLDSRYGGMGIIRKGDGFNVM